MQLPEEFNLELLDVLPKEAIEEPALCDAFENSLAWRSPKAFTSRTAGWVDKLCPATGRSAYGLMLLVSTEPENLFNANWLHEDLWPRSMPQRDAAWSVYERGFAFTAYMVFMLMVAEQGTGGRSHDNPQRPPTTRCAPASWRSA